MISRSLASIAPLALLLACMAGVVTAQEGGSGSAPGSDSHSSSGSHTGFDPDVAASAPGVAAHAHAGHEMPAAAPFDDPLADIVVDFELVGRDGATVTAADFLGRQILLGFGFTHCPAVCPMMALNMGKALRDTEVDAVGIFVSVDTERDSPAITDAYAARFGERMLGLGGNVSQINAAANNFKVSYVVTKTQNAYTVQHTANVFLIGPDGRLIDVFDFSTPAEELAAAMREAAAEHQAAAERPAAAEHDMAVQHRRAAARETARRQAAEQPSAGTAMTNTAASRETARRPAAGRPLR